MNPANPSEPARSRAPETHNRLRRRWGLAALGVLLAPGAVCATAQVSFYTAVDLSLRNSQEVRMAESDVRRALAGLQESRDAYIPNFVLGSGLGYSYGFPVGQPSVFNGTSQSLLLSFSQPDYIRSARASLKAAQFSLKDMRQKVAAEAASAYVELTADNQQLAALDQQHDYGQHLIEIEQQRLAAGFDSKLDETRAELNNAQLELRRIHLQKHAALLQARLAHLTGLPETNIATQGESIPPPPSFAANQNYAALAAQENDGLHASDAAARSKMYVAFGDERQNYHPEIAFALQYSRFAKFNNYQIYYNRFQHNNFDVGIQLSLPLFDAVRRAKARGSSADAEHAQAQANQNRQQFSEQVLELQNSLDELAAQQKVARLESDYARELLQSVTTQLQSGSAGNGGTPLTPKDEELAKIEERRRYADLIDANLQLTEAQINLLRSLGRVEDWARQAPKQ